jgi:PAS domain-containing protein
MTSTDHTGADEGGEAPCFAHLLDGPQHVNPELLGQLVNDLANAVVADGERSITFGNDAATRLVGWTPDMTSARSHDLTIPERQRDH